MTSHSQAEATTLPEVLEEELCRSQDLREVPCMGSELLELTLRVLAAGPAGLDFPCARCRSKPQQVSLRKDAFQQRFGVVCAILPSGGLAVTELQDGGIVQLWNDACSRACEPWKRVHLGCAILSVNGITGNTKQMQQELQTKDEIELLLCNPPSIASMKSILAACESGDVEHDFWSSAAPSSCTAPSSCSSCSFDGLISVIITTSPVPSNPSTLLLQRVLDSFQLIPGLTEAPKLIVCDGYRIAAKSNPKAGKISSTEASRYEAFTERLRSLRSLPLAVLALEERHGFGWAVKMALQQIHTPFVLVVQHDQEFISTFHLPAVLETMSKHPEVKYVGLSSVSTLNYESLVRSKFGVKISQTMEFGIPLLPLIFFYDKPHICSTAHYRDVILGPGSSVQKGDFIEETVGIAQREDIIKNGMAAHVKYGTFQLDTRDESGREYAVVRHINGRSFFSPEQRVARGWTATLHFAA